MYKNRTVFMSTNWNNLIRSSVAYLRVFLGIISLSGITTCMCEFLKPYKVILLYFPMLSKFLFYNPARCIYDMSGISRADFAVIRLYFCLQIIDCWLHISSRLYRIYLQLALSSLERCIAFNTLLHLGHH